jgi:hypothetical protein
MQTTDMLDCETWHRQQGESPKQWYDRLARIPSEGLGDRAGLLLAGLRRWSAALLRQEEREAPARVPREVPVLCEPASPNRSGAGRSRRARRRVQQEQPASRLEELQRLFLGLGEQDRRDFLAWLSRFGDLGLTP